MIEVRSKSFGLVTERCHYNARPINGYCSSYLWDVRQVLLFIVECGIARFLCACVHYVPIRHSGIILIPSATLVPNFVSVAPSIAELANGGKSRTQSLSHPDYLIRPEQKLSLRKMFKLIDNYLVHVIRADILVLLGHY